jgi:Cu/Zn superoxide dismutase
MHLSRTNKTALLLASLAGFGMLWACSSDDTTNPSSSTDGGVDSTTGGDTGSSDTGSGTDSSKADTGSDAPPVGKQATVTIAPYGTTGTTTGSGTFVQTDGPGGSTQVTFTLDVQNAVPGSRGVHVHVGSSCAVGAPGAHFNPGPVPLNGQWDNIQVDDAGTGHLVSPMTAGGAPGNGLTLDPYSDAGPGIVGRVIAVHGAPNLLPDGGPVLTEAGTPAPPPINGCGVIIAK